MAIYIKGIEMPTSPVLFCVHPDGKVFADLEGGWREYKAVPVPPHGRLIDADSLIREHRADNFDFAIYACCLVQNAPTIIQEEEEGHA